MARLPGSHRLAGLQCNVVWIIVSGLLGLLAGAVSRRAGKFCPRAGPSVAAVPE